MMRSRISRAVALVLAALCVAAQPAPAADLTFGARADPSVDPHFLYLSTNMAYSRHIFDALVDKDETSQRRPGLAVSWSVVAPTIWEFRLRPGVKFHDGSDFTAADVAFTIARVAGLPNNPNPYTNNILLLELLLVGGSYVMAPVAAGQGAVPFDGTMENTRALGQVLYTRYVFIFQSAGAVLLVAMIGAIVLTLRHKPNVKRQNVLDQVSRKRSEAVEVVKVKSGQGI